MVYLSWAANALLFVAACFLAADTANAVFASLLAEETAFEPPPPVVASRGSAPGWPERQVIVERNLFGAATADGSQQVVEIEEDLEETKLPLTLLGTAAAEDPFYAWAAVQDDEARQTLVVTIGDLLKEKAEVLRIERRRIVLSEDGQPRELTFGDEEAEPSPIRRNARRRRASARAARRSSRDTDATAAIRKLAEDRFAVSRAEAERVLDDPTDILSQARFLPKYEGTEMVGFQISGIKQDSVLREFGLQDGDLITEFNGVRISGPADTARLLQEFNEGGPLRIVTEDADGNESETVVEFGE